MMRVVVALERVRHEKIAAGALGIGYRGKHNFYKVFRQLTGMTPTEFRALPEERAREMIDAIRRHLKRGS